MTLHEGDTVHFKGNPDETFTVDSVKDFDGSCRLVLDDATGLAAWIPDRLLDQPQPPKPQQGELWELKSTGALYFVVWVHGGHIRYALSGSATTYDTDASSIDDRYRRVYPPE